MSFISVEFILFFLVTVTLFWFVPRTLKVTFLLVASLVFYGASSSAHVILLAGMTLADFVIARGMGRSSSLRARTGLLAVSLSVNMVGLLTFKYAGLLDQTLASILGHSRTGISALMPLGISFYTLTKIAYVVDVYRRKIVPEHDLTAFAAFVSFFPNTASGPIERAGHLLPQLKAAVIFDHARTVEGLRLILLGAFKKIVIADRLAIYVNAIYCAPRDHQGLSLITATLFLSFQIYADFSGYTDIARGIARVFGIDLFENFRQPYFSKSIFEFWRRWHMSLTSWIREYLFFPLSRYLLISTKRRHPMLIEVSVYLIVMSLVGLWHGPNWTFLVWGALHGLYMAGDVILKPFGALVVPDNRLTGIFKALTVFLLVTLAWVFFRADSLADATYIFGNLLNFGGSYLASFRVYTPNPQGYGVQLLLCVGLIVVLLSIDIVDARRGLLKVISSQPVALRWTFYYVLVAFIFVVLISVKVIQDFVYFQF